MSDSLLRAEYKDKERRFPSNRYTPDHEENIKDGIRDDMNGRHDSLKRTGKIIHVHPTIREKPRDPSPRKILMLCWKLLRKVMRRVNS